MVNYLSHQATYYLHPPELVHIHQSLQYMEPDIQILHTFSSSPPPITLDLAGSLVKFTVNSWSPGLEKTG